MSQQAATGSMKTKELPTKGRPKQSGNQVIAHLRNQNDVLLKSLQREQLLRQQQEENLREVRLAHARQITLLDEQVQEASRSHGSNTIKKSNFNSYDHASNDNLKNFIRFQVMPHHKFLHKSWTRFAPNDPHSFYYKTMPEFEVPEDCVPSTYWRDKQVPQLNKKITDWRSNVNKCTKPAYFCK